MKVKDLKVGNRFYVMMEVYYKREAGEKSVDLCVVPKDDEDIEKGELDYVNQDVLDNMHTKSLTKAQLNAETKTEIKKVEAEMSLLKARLAALNKRLK